MLETIWNFITDIVPVERWVRSIGNVLKFLGLAFVLVFLLIAGLVFRSWGFSPEQRIDLIHWFLGLMFLVLIVAVVLAMLPGGLLYNPYERSLNRGRRYGTQRNPRMRAEVEAEPRRTNDPALPSPTETALPRKETERQ